LPSIAAGSRFANVFIDIDNRRAASETLAPSVIASFTTSSRNSSVYAAFWI
jgi:hypothetical protein